ncbi:hypothetical protein AcV5_006504 [Taiwanofungus camphoratus]|nr:hypothetical protein AcV5_006504 [Antrodia cinnamomea]KAI0949942.1 hypothetical protein AcV7_008563 [Antrodia cinnamomea]
MYSNHRLDTPPPSSRLRRPWSPDPYDPLPSVSQHHQDEPAYYIPGQYAEQRREPSDASVEALDLADYSATLTRNNGNIHRPLPFHAYDPYPPSPPPLRPLASSESLHPPSLVSPSASSLHSLASSTSRAPIRRPFSLPAPSYPQRSLQSHPPLSNHTHAWPEPRIQSPDNDEIDIAHFPSFTHAWYEGGNAHTRLSPPPSACDAKLSPFDPAYPTHAYDYSPYAHSPPPSYPSGSSRDLATVPWGAGSTESGAPIDPGLKEERMRMLEREFGGKGVGQGEKDEDEDGEKVGGVDAKGRLITQGPKKRLAVRMLQALLALLAAVSSIYAAAVIKPPSAPPPAGKMPAYILYVLSVFSFLASTYVFLIYPCCCGARKAKKDLPYAQGPGGLMVLPVQGLPGGKKKGKRGKKGTGGGGESVQVNLIVDPTLFGGGGERARGADAEWEDDGPEGSSEYGAPGSRSGASSAARRPPPRRRGIFAGLAMEAQWRRARKVLKWGMVFDVCAAVLWGAEFVIILLGKRCPVGGFDGWCNAYNLATAISCLLCLAFGISVFFDVKDLHASKASPRTRL